MKALKITALAMSVLVGTAAPAAFGLAQHGERNEHAAPQHEQSRPDQARPTQQGRQTQPTQQPQQVHPQQGAQQQQMRSAQAQPAQHQAVQNRYGQQERANAGQRQMQARQNTWQQHRAGNWETDHRTWQQRGGYRGYRISTLRFRGHFGADHGFRLNGLPFQSFGGYPRFRYQGYWFGIVDPWPGSWANNWYDTDEVYVVSGDNGYYLYNRSHPNVGLAIRISL